MILKRFGLFAEVKRFKSENVKMFAGGLAEFSK